MSSADNSKFFYIFTLSFFILIFAFFITKKTVVAPSLGTLPISESKPRQTTLLAVGDIMLSRNVGAKIDKANDPNLPFANLQNLISNADIAFGNLECPLSPSAISIKEGLVFRCLTKYVPGLVNAGFDALSTANNHSFDQGADAVKYTYDYLKQNNILPVGTSPSPDEGRVPEAGGVIKRNDINFGFLAYGYSAFNDGKFSTHPQIATMNIQNLQSDIANVKSQGADIIIVSMHAGTEYTREPNQMQIEFAHAAIDAGADAVIGHHPHWIQTIEIYNNKPIFYSLGNFVFDQMWSRETREGLAVELTYREQELQSAKLIPIIIENFCCPRLATDEEKTAILEKIDLDSTILNFSQ